MVAVVFVMVVILLVLLLMVVVVVIMDVAVVVWVLMLAVVVLLLRSFKVHCIWVNGTYAFRAWLDPILDRDFSLYRYYRAWKYTPVRPLGGEGGIVEVRARAKDEMKKTAWTNGTGGIVDGKKDPIIVLLKDRPVGTPAVNALLLPPGADSVPDYFITMGD